MPGETCVRCRSTEGDLDASGICHACRAKETPAGTGTVQSLPPDPNDRTASNPIDFEATRSADGNVGFDHFPSYTLSFSNYDLHEIIGRGGMGIVYRATQKIVNRVVALKVLAGAGDLDDRQKYRFKGEAESLGRARHPGIVQIYDVGEENGRPFFSMEYVPGGTLARTVKGEGRVAPRRAAGLIAAVARAVDAAHAVGVIHRDLKPSNILLAADGTPRVADFGLAVLTDRDSRVTNTGALLGTPSYMSPEQAAGKKEDVTVRTDVYALGATLYELLTGQPPFKADTTVATAVKVMNDPVVPPSHFNPKVPASLEAVCLKCLCKPQQDRYPTAAALADDLDAFAADRPVAAKPAARPPTGRKKRLALFGLVPFAIVLGMFAVWDRDPKKRIERDLAAGKEVELVGHTGLPKWHRWETGEVPFDMTLTSEGCLAFQSQMQTALTLCDHPPTDEYHVVVNVKHIRLGSGEGSYCGLYTFSGDVTSGDGIVVRRRVNAYYSDFNPVKYMKLQGGEELWVTKGEELHPIRCPLPSINISPPEARNSPPWRTIVMSVDAVGVRTYWKDANGWIEIPPSEDPDHTRTLFAEALKKQYGPNAPSQPAWLPHGSIGILLNNGTAAFRDIVIRPKPFSPR
jgi:serine/threonine-protein kinase